MAVTRPYDPRVTTLSSYSLAEMISPTTTEAFVNSHWESKPLLVKREDPTYYRDLLSLSDCDRVITEMSPRFPDVQLINAHSPVEPQEYLYPNDYIDVARLYQQFAKGGTILLGNLESSLPKIANMCRSLEREMSARFQANVYFTPPNAKGFRRHWDAHDVFVLQVEGTKHWRCYDHQVLLPLKGERFDPDEAWQGGEVTEEFVLEAGDFFYLPRGIMHDAVTHGEGHSLHITVGIISVSWAELFMEAVAKVGTGDEAFRRSLPAGYAHPDFDRSGAERNFRDLLHRVVENIDFHGALDHFADDLISSRHGLLAGQLDQILRLPNLTMESEVGARPDLMFHLRKTDTHVTVSCYGGQTQLPVHAAEPLEFALRTQRFRVDELPGDLDDDGKRVLVELLVREGLVIQH